MHEQHTTQADGGRGMVVPLGLAGLQVVSQWMGPDGAPEVTGIGTQTRAACPRCGRGSAKQRYALHTALHLAWAAEAYLKTDLGWHRLSATEGACGL